MLPFPYTRNRRDMSHTSINITNKSMKIESASEVRKHFQETIDHVHYTKAPVVVTKNNKPWIMIQALPEDDKDMQKLINTQT